MKIPWNLFFSMDKAGVMKWNPFWGNQTMRIYGNFEGFPLFLCIVWVGNIMTTARVYLGGETSFFLFSARWGNDPI